MFVLGDRFHPITHSQTVLKTMSLTSWAKRSPSNTSAILVVLIAAIGLNLHYRDRPTTEAATQATNISMTEINASPKVKAFLKTIRWAEGTDGIDGYKTQYTGAKFEGFDDHPRQVKCSVFNGEKLCSDASGAYQAISPTWDRIKQKANLKDFSPTNQDLFALQLLKEVGAIALIEKDDIAGAIAAAAPTWASLPRFDGDMNGVYDQAVKPMPALLQRYKEALGR